MKLKEILSPSFNDFKKPRKPMITVSTDSDFCREVVARGWLTEEKMHHAAARYRLGKSRSGRTIFWMIDERGICRDGHIGEAWVSQMLKAREPKLLQFWHAEHSLFGLHLLSHTDLTDPTDLSIVHYPLSISAVPISVKISEICVPNKTICVVEAEKRAVILSELYPQYLWLATVYPVNLTPKALKPLKGHRVILLPPADPTGETYVFWLEIATHARRLYHLDISVHYSNFFQT
jgi:hypothetical protein